MQLLGINEIAETLGVSRQRADQLAKRPDFPKPVAELRMGRIWRASDFEKWRKRNDR